MGGFQDDSSASHFSCTQFLGLLHQLHLRSSGIRSQRLETPTLILLMMDSDALSHLQSLENLFSTKQVPGAKNVGDHWFAEQKDLFLVGGSSGAVTLRIFASVCVTVITKHPFSHCFITKGTAILRMPTAGTCCLILIVSLHGCYYQPHFLNRETEAQQD